MIGHLPGPYLFRADSPRPYSVRKFSFFTGLREILIAKSF